MTVITNDIMKKALRFSGTVSVLASEEEDVPVSVLSKIKDKYAEIGLRTTQFKNDVLVEKLNDGGYVAVFDPLDGSSNVDAGIPTGTIFGVFEQSDADVSATCPLSCYLSSLLHTNSLRIHRNAFSRTRTATRCQSAW